MHLRLFLFSGLAILSLAGCKKNNVTPANEDKGVDIYAVGFAPNTALTTTLPVYWKNGVKTLLSGQDIIANRVAVLNKDVYITSTPNPGYWKNGTYTAFPVSDNINTSIGRSVFTDGTDVYIGGGGTKYYKNGIAYNFVTPCKSFNVKEGHFYSVIWDTTNSKYVYYKDDVKIMTLEYDKGFSFSPVGVDVYNNNVYIAGNLINNKDGTNSGAYWKNGVLYAGFNDESLKGFSVSSMAVNETGLHLAGSAGGGATNTIAIYWHNGAKNKLSGLPGAISTYALDICTYKSDVYLSGSTNRQACYWKNGELVVLYDPVPDLIFSRATGIIVAPR